MTRIRRVLDWLWSIIGLVLVFSAGMTAGQWIGFGKGAHAIAELVYEMRHTSYETPEPWDRGEI